MGILLIVWLFFSVCVGAIAQARGRSLLFWSVVAGIISPILAGIIVFSIEDNSQEGKNEPSEEDRSIGISKFRSKVERFSDLYVEGLLTEEEYSLKKSELIKKLGRNGINSKTEDFLDEVKYLRDEDIIDKNEVEKLKSLVL